MVIQFDEQDIYRAIRAAGVDPVQTGKIKSILDAHRKGEEGVPHRKDTVGVRPLLDGRIYENGPFSAFTDEVTSLVITSGSPLMSWIPTRPIRSRKSQVSHIDFIAPKGFTGAETYPDWLASIQIGECGYGPEGTAWNGFTYRMDSGSYSFRTTPMKPYEDGGLKYYEEQPLIAIRGAEDIVGSPVIGSDADWALARLLWVMEEHMNYLIPFGDRANSEMEWDGVDVINRPGYVAARATGPGLPTWADPIWVNGAGVSNVSKILQTLRVVVRLLRKRANARRWTMGDDDMIIYMDATMWDNIREAIAAGAMYQFSSAFGFDGRITFRDYRDEYRATGSGGLGMGAIDIDGRPVPVLADPNLGAGVNLTVDDGQGGTMTVPAVAGDIQVLTRRVAGYTLWWQEYLNWDDLEVPMGQQSIGTDRFTLQGGLVRAGWVQEANKCFYYFGEMVGRLICTLLPMQARISNVIIPVLDAMEREQQAFWTRNFYAFNGQTGGSGTALLNPTP